MKRQFFAYIIIAVCFVTSLIIKQDISGRVDNCISYISKIEKSVINKDYKTAHNYCGLIKNEYKNNITMVMYCYYKHDILEDINNTLSDLNIYILNKDITNINVKTEEIKNKLQAVKNREQINLRNIM